MRIIQENKKLFIILLLMIPYVIGGLSSIYSEMSRAQCTSGWYYTPDTTEPPVVNTTEKVEAQKFFYNRFCSGESHGFFGLLGTMWLGCCLIIYRILRDIPTRRVKYIHLLMHCGTVALYSLCILSIHNERYSSTFNYLNYHAMNALVLLNSYAIQFILAFFIYVYLLVSCGCRIGFSPFHDLFGVWIYIIAVACCLSGKVRARLDYNLDGKRDMFFIYTYIGFFWILVIIISPYFEWELTGNP